jgi:hypothetical protein
MPSRIAHLRSSRERGRESGKPIDCSKPPAKQQPSQATERMLDRCITHHLPPPRYLRVFCDALMPKTRQGSQIWRAQEESGPQFLPFSPALISPTPRPGLLARVKRRGGSGRERMSDDEQKE